MVEKQKPEYDVVKRAAQLIKKPQEAKPKDIQRMAGRILNDEKNAPDQNRIKPKPAPPKPRAPARKSPGPRR